MIPATNGERSGRNDAFRPIIFEDYRDMSTPSASAFPEPVPSIAPWLSHVLVSRKRMHDEPKMQAKKSQLSKQNE